MDAGSPADTGLVTVDTFDLTSMAARPVLPAPLGNDASGGQSPPVGDTKAAIRFLEAFEPGAWHLVSIVPDGAPTSRTFDQNERPAAAEWIEARQGRENLYFHVNRLRQGFRDRKAKKEHIVEARYLHVDVDDDQALAQLAGSDPKPTVVVFSGGGYQGFWLLSAPTDDLALVERLNVALKEVLGGDNCQDISRIMRLPGTINIPNEKKRQRGRTPILAELVEDETDWSSTYSLEELAAALLPRTGGTPTDGAVVPAVPPPSMLGQLPNNISDYTKKLMADGDDRERPIGSAEARYKSRSEALFRVTCDLVRAGWAKEQIAEVLLDPSNGISTSVLDKTNPREYAEKQIRSAGEAVGNSWDIDRSRRRRPTLLNTRRAIVAWESIAGTTRFAIACSLAATCSRAFRAI